MLKITLIYEDNQETIEFSTSSMDNEAEDKIKKYLLDPTTFQQEIDEGSTTWEFLGISYFAATLIDDIKEEIEWLTERYTEEEMFRVQIET